MDVVRFRNFGLSFVGFLWLYGVIGGICWCFVVDISVGVKEWAERGMERFSWIPLVKFLIVSSLLKKEKRKKIFFPKP
jgi:hypothetical protein